MTRQEIKQKMDELAREYAENADGRKSESRDFASPTA